METISTPTQKTVLEYFNSIEKPCASIFAAMEDRGVRIDTQYLQELKEYLEDQKIPIEKAIKNELGDINLNSPKQLLGALHAKEIYPEYKGKGRTDKRALERIRQIPIIEQLLCFSELETLLSSFVYPYLERQTEIVHPFFNQCGTRTGRPSCSNPNLLQIPKRTEYGKLVRRMFIARDGFLFGDCDFGQIEPRILAHLSKDKMLCEMFNSGVDFHDYTGDRLNISREAAKILNLSVGYRATFKSVSQQLKCTDNEAQKEIDRWWAMFPELRAWQDKLIWQSKKDGYFTTLMGRRIKVDNLNEYNKWKREHAHRQLINNIAQASAAEVMKMAMININKMDCIWPLVQVYDELLFEVIDWDIMRIEAAKLYMENAVKLDVPLVVEAKSGPNWADVQ